MEILIIHNPADKIREQNILEQFKKQTGDHSYTCITATMDFGTPAVGIAKSFKSCIQYAMNKKLEQVCILEDDFDCLLPNSLTKFFNIWEQYQELQSGILLGGIYEGTLKPSVEKQLPYAKVLGKLSGLHATIVPQNQYESIMEAKIPFQLDWWLSMEIEIPIYTAYPFLVMQKDGFYSYNAKQVMNYTKYLRSKYLFADDVK
jgi:hypothetical protein